MFAHLAAFSYCVMICFLLFFAWMMPGNKAQRFSIAVLAFIWPVLVVAMLVEGYLEGKAQRRWDAMQRALKKEPRYLE